MGSVREELRQVSAPADAVEDELPAHQVKIVRPVAMSVHEVTRKQFAAFVRDTGHRAASPITYLRKTAPLPCAAPWRRGVQQPTHPVVCVSWHDANGTEVAVQVGWPFLSPPSESRVGIPRGAGSSAPVSGAPRSRPLPAVCNIATTAVCRFTVGMLKTKLSVCRWLRLPRQSVPTAHAFVLYDMIGKPGEWYGLL